MKSEKKTVKKIVNIPEILDNMLGIAIQDLGITETSFIKMALWDKLKEYRKIVNR